MDIKIRILFVLTLCSLFLLLSAKEVLPDSFSDDSSMNDFINKFDSEKLKRLMEQLNLNDKSCEADYTKFENKIIRPRESLKNGAKFLKTVTNETIKSSEDCMRSCCNVEDRKCDAALYQKSLSRCFLFQCYNEVKKDYSCLFTADDGYIFYKYRGDTVTSPLEDLESVAKADLAPAKNVVVPTEITKVTEALTTAKTAEKVNEEDLNKVENTQIPQQKKEEADPKKVETKEKNGDQSKEESGTSPAPTSPAPEVIYVTVADEADSAILPLAIGLAVTALVLIMVVCRIQIMKKKLLIGRGKYMKMKMDESDYLINGMYL